MLSFNVKNNDRAIFAISDSTIRHLKQKNIFYSKKRTIYIIMSLTLNIVE